MVATRLYCMAEEKGWLNAAQAGFRKRRSCEDQDLRVTQAISDGFQSKKRSVLVLLDYSKAYDKIWREELLLSMHATGVPALILRWINGFLQNRQAKVSYNNVLSRSRRLRQGLPQRSVLAPLLFLFYINSVTENVPGSVNSALYDDDVSLLASHHDKASAVSDLQQAVDAVAMWSKKKKMTLNTDKSEVAFFSIDTHEAKWQPIISLNGSQLPFNVSPRLLGVYLDRTLSFSHHTDMVCKKASSRCRALAALSTKEWGWRKRPMRKLYISLIRSCMDFAAPAWQPWLSATKFNALEVTQNKALCIMTGQASTTPVEALRAESGICSYRTVSDQLCVKAYEKAARFPDDHPKRIALTDDCHHRLHRSSWRKHATELLSTLSSELQNREPVDPISDPFRRIPQQNWTVLTGTVCLSDVRDTETLRREALSSISMHGPADFIIYTDGSASEGMHDGGAAAVITTGPADHPTVVDTLRQRGRAITSSYEEERCHALGLGVDCSEQTSGHDSNLLR